MNPRATIPPKKLLEKLAALYQRFQQMPFFLQVLTAANLICGLWFGLWPLLPGTVLNLDGTMLSHADMWATKNAWAMFAICALMLTATCGLFRRAKWVRPLVVTEAGLQIIPFKLVHAFYGDIDPLPWTQDKLLTLAILMALLWFYLYKNPNVQRYFTGA